MNNCPKCNSNWIGGEIPEDIREHYSPPYHWKREIGIDGIYVGIYDGVVAIMCPDCKEVMPRNNQPWGLEMFDKYLEYIKDEEEKSKKKSRN